MLESWGDSLIPIRKQSGRARRGIALTTCRVLLAAAASAVWLSATPAHATSTAVAAQTGNLLQGDNATFSTSIGTWSNFSNANLQWAAMSGQGGTGGLVLTATGPNMTVLSGTATNGGLTPASADSIYSGAISAEAPTGSVAIQPALIFYTGTGTMIRTVFGPSVTAQTSSWTQSSPVVAIAPANTADVVLALVVYNSGASSKVVFDNAWIEQTSEATTPSVVGPLSTSGNTILQANGAPFVPRGVVLNGLETIPTASTVTEQAVIQAKAWGANIIRLPLGEQFWLSSNCDYSPGYQAEVNQVVNWITSLGMVALLDLHTNTVQGCEPGGPHNMADEAQSPTFWNQVAAQYASNPLVAFDLYNEPHNIPSQVWLNGGLTVDVYRPYQIYQAAGMQQLYNAVRVTGAKNLVFISGLNWANDPPSQPVSGNNIVYAAHAYTCPDNPPPSCASLTPYDPSSILKPWVAFSSTHPVAVTEFGWPSQGDGTYLANLITYVRTQGWGWIAFAWEDSPYPAGWDLTARWLPNLPAEPAPSGIPVICEFVRVSTGASPCVAPSITSPTSPTSQTASPTAPTAQAKPSGASTVNTTAPQPQNVLAHPTTAEPLATSPVRGSSSTFHPCTTACDSYGSPVGAAYSQQIDAAKRGYQASGSIARTAGEVVVWVVLGTFIVPTVVRRLRRASAKSA